MHSSDLSENAPLRRHREDLRPRSNGAPTLSGLHLLDVTQIKATQSYGGLIVATSFSDGDSLFQRMLEFDPADRITAAEALNAEYFGDEENSRATRLDIITRISDT